MASEPVLCERDDCPSAATFKCDGVFLCDRHTDERVRVAVFQENRWVRVTSILAGQPVSG
jgi:hypothetical protein